MRRGEIARDGEPKAGTLRLGAFSEAIEDSCESLTQRLCPSSRPCGLPPGFLIGRLRIVVLTTFYVTTTKTAKRHPAAVVATAARSIGRSRPSSQTRGHARSLQGVLAARILVRTDTPLQGGSALTPNASYCPPGAYAGTKYDADDETNNQGQPTLH